MPLNRSRQGAALITTLIMIVVVGGIALLMFNRTMSEMNHSRDNATITQMVMLAQGGANVGGVLLRDQALLEEIQEVVKDKGRTDVRWTFGGDGLEPDPSEVANTMNDVARVLQSEVDDLLCGNNYRPKDSTAMVTVRVHFVATACATTSPFGLPNKTTLPDGRFVQGQPRDTAAPNSYQVYALPFVMVTEAVQGDYKRNIVLQGEYRFSVGRSSFARFAYFANERRVPRSDGTKIPVTFGTGEMVDGPVHSNEYLRYWGNPWFGGAVTVAGCENPTVTSCNGTPNPGDFFNGGFRRADELTTYPDPAYCVRSAGQTCPTFASGVTWGADYIPLPTNNFNQRDAAALAGLAFPNTLKDLKLSILTENNKTYQVIRTEMCANAPLVGQPNDLTCNDPTVVQEFRFTDNREEDKGFPLETKDAAGNWVTYTNPANEPYYFNGVLYTAGGIASLGGPTRTSPTDPDSAEAAVASFAQFTLAATGKTVVTRDLKYQQPPCDGSAQWNNGNVTRATCEATDKIKNILGVYSQDGDLLFGTGDTTTFSNLTAHGVFMSSEGRVGTNNWDTVRNTKTSLNIMGGLIGNVVAGFSTGSGGYLRNVTYDPRTGNGIVPPFFPSTGEDEAQKPSFFSFGQREQVY
jgi:hypothetical protein